MSSKRIPASVFQNFTKGRLLSRKWALFFALAGTIALPAPVRAEYSPNDHLRERLALDSGRVLPESEFYSLAMDIEFFKPGPLSDDIKQDNYSFNQWHGNGYWLDTRIEIRPLDAIRLNWKLSAYQGSSSGGPSGYGARLFSRAAGTLDDQLGNTKWRYYARLSDLGRQTLGRGLVIEERETVGFFTGLTHGDWKFQFMVDGTGGVWLEGEAFSLAAEWRRGLAGLVLAKLTEDPGVGRTLRPIDHLVSLYSSSPIAIGGRLAYDFELGYANGAFASLAGLRFKHQRENQFLEVRPQVRRYFPGFAAGVGGRTEPVFLAYDQMEDRFTNFQNIFAYGSNVSVASLYVKAAKRFVPWFGLTSEHEMGTFHYGLLKPQNFHFFKSGFQIFPVRERDDEIFVFLSNKWMNGVVFDSNNQPYTVTPETIDQTTRPKFINALYIGLIARARF